MYTAYREEYCENWENACDAYKGKTVLDRIDKQMNFINNINERSSLWYFEMLKWIRKPSNKQFRLWTKETYAFLGVFDLDFDISIEERNELVQNAKSKQLTMISEEKLDMVKKNLHQFDKAEVYFSGSKGFHVYIWDKRFLTVVENPRWLSNRATIETFFRSLSVFDEEFLQMIDYSIYRHGSGIRPYYMSHPKTKIRPFLLYRQGFSESKIREYSYGGIWQWIRKHVKNPDFPYTEIRTEELKRKALLIQDDDDNDNSETMKTSIVNGVSDSILESIEYRYKEETNESGFLSKLPGEGSYKSRNMYCFCLGGMHSRAKGYWKIYENVAIQKCFSEKCKNKDYVLKSARLSELEPVTAFISESGDQIKTEKIASCGQKYLPENLISRQLEEHKRLFVAAPMGSGKTTQAKQIIREKIEENPDFTCLILCTRICQSKYFTTLFEELGFQSYLSKEGCLYDSKRLVICINSVMRLLMCSGGSSKHTIPVYDMLIIDEVETFAQTLGSPLMNSHNCHQNLICDVVNLMFSSSKQVLMMDGLPGYASKSYLLNVLPKARESVKILIHDSKPETRVYEIVDNPYVFEGQILRYLETGENIAMVTNSKKVVRYYMALDKIKNLPDHEKLAIYGKADEEARNTVADPSVGWNGKRFLVYNTAVGPGPSFDVEHYSRLVVFLTCTSGQANEMYQLFSRVRKFRQSKVLVYLMFRKPKTNSTSEINLETESLQNIVNYFKEQTSLLNFVVEQEPEEEPEESVITPMLRKRMLGGETVPVLKEPIKKTAKFYTELALQDQKLVRVPVIRPSIRIRLETSGYIRLIAAVKEEALKSRDSEYFKSRLIELIVRNGGIVIDKQRKEISKKIRQSQTAYEQTVMELDDGIDSWIESKVDQYFGSDTLRKKAYYETFDASDSGLQLRFSKLCAAMKNTSKTYENEILYNYHCQLPDYEEKTDSLETNEIELMDHAAKPVSGTTNWSIVAQNLKRILENMENIVIGVHGEVYGEIGSQNVENSRNFLGATKAIFTEFGKTNPLMLPKELYGSVKMLETTRHLKMFQELFRYCGYQSKLTTGSRNVIIDGKRVRQRGLLLDGKNTKSRLALMGKLEGDTKNYTVNETLKELLF